MNKFAIFSLFAAAALSLAVSAKPIKPQRLDVWSPHITAPVAGVSWPAGSQQTVTWATDDIPRTSDTGNHGLLLLGHGGGPGISENLNITHPLAVNFPISDGTVSFTLLDAPPRDDYFVVLFGDSGNKSPPFSITEGDDSS
ncbi:hypothetical protein PLICRDRAFT_114099 [Plicaturopsis crispa FD-325 SS-3]|nr:hypothetical protein PLICRDRAFT_114099 [Plicaturopsis crispa FD-325 SS-3]